MKKLSARLPVFGALFAAAVISGASAGTLTLNSPSAPNAAGLVTVVANSGFVLAESNNYSGGTYISSGTLTSGGTLNLTGTTTDAIKSPDLSGSAGDLKITAVNGGNMIRVKTLVSVSNTGTKAAKNVSATVYLSDDAVLDAEDLKIRTLYLKDYVPGATKLLKGQTLSLPIKQKTPASVASYLEGKYLIAVLGADNLVSIQEALYPISFVTSTTPTVFMGGNGNLPLASVSGTPKNQVVIGPIHLPTTD